MDVVKGLLDLHIPTQERRSIHNNISGDRLLNEHWITKNKKKAVKEHKNTKLIFKTKKSNNRYIRQYPAFRSNHLSAVINLQIEFKLFSQLLNVLKYVYFGVKYR